jgi:hypothetical protein
MGPARLMDLLRDEREAVRNESLLLLSDLTQQHPDLQKILAFEGIFESLLHVVQEEGGVDGSVVVQDCLRLLNSLLRGNVSNQVTRADVSEQTWCCPLFPLTLSVCIDLDLAPIRTSSERPAASNDCQRCCS